MTWIVSQLVRGGSVGDRLKAHPGGLRSRRRRPDRRQVVDALHFAHDHNVIHRDVKPATCCSGSQRHRSARRLRGRLCRRGLPRQTVDSARWWGRSRTCRRSRPSARPSIAIGLYALGAMLFELVCGQAPFRSESVVAVLVKHVNDPVPRVADLNPAVPGPLSHLIAQLMSKRPDDRPASGRASLSGARRTREGRAGEWSRCRLRLVRCFRSRWTLPLSAGSWVAATRWRSSTLRGRALPQDSPSSPSSPASRDRQDQLGRGIRSDHSRARSVRALRPLR